MTCIFGGPAGRNSRLPGIQAVEGFLVVLNDSIKVRSKIQQPFRRKAKAKQTPPVLQATVSRCESTVVSSPPLLQATVS